MNYYLPPVVSIESIYTEILPTLTRRYNMRQIDERIVISFAQTQKVHANAIPVLASILNILKNRSGKAVYLELVCNIRLLFFLDSIDFFSQLRRIGIIEYDEDMLGGFYDLQLQYNIDHKMHIYSPCSNVEELSPEEKKKRRDENAAGLRTLIQHIYINSVSDKHKLSDQEQEQITTVIAELITNGIIHSQSICYDYFQSGINIKENKKQILISVADAGIGFIQSIDNKLGKEYSYKDRDKFYEMADSYNISRDKYRNYLGIMEALFFSQLMTAKREVNLYEIKNKLPYMNANLRIFFKNTQIVFTANRCRGCDNKAILNCLHCLYIRSRTSSLQKSPLKIYPSSLSGVHIDIEFIREV